MQRVALLTLCLALVNPVASSPLAAAEPKAVAAPRRVQSTNFLGQPAFALTGSALQAVVVPNLGGRLLEYSINGENVLLDSFGTLPLAPTAIAPGYQCDIGPELRGIPSHDRLWTGPWDAKPLGNVGLKVTSERDLGLGVQLEKEFLVEPESGDLGLTQRMRNVGKGESAYCFWDRTVCKGGGFAFVPLKKKSRFPARWSVRRTVAGKSVYDGAKPAAANVRVLDRVLVAKCEGEPTKIGADSDAGWIGYVRGRWLLVKYFPYLSKGNYSDGGNTVEVYFDRQVAELGPVSPEVKLKPNETYEFPEKWTLIELDGRITSFEEVRALVDKVPESPF